MIESGTYKPILSTGSPNEFELIRSTPVMSAGMQTMIGEDIIPSQIQAGPPELMVAIAGENLKAYSLTQLSLSIRRVEGNDIVIPPKIVSQQHARLEKVDGNLCTQKGGA